MFILYLDYTVVAAIVTELKHYSRRPILSQSEIKELRNAIHYSHYKHNEPGDESRSGNLKSINHNHYVSTQENQQGTKKEKEKTRK
jgi:hypothetical protein